MSVRTRNGYRDTRRAAARDNARNTRRRNADLAWLAAVSNALTGARY